MSQETEQREAQIRELLASTDPVYWTGSEDWAAHCSWLLAALDGARKENGELRKDVASLARDAERWQYFARAATVGANEDAEVWVGVNVGEQDALRVAFASEMKVLDEGWISGDPGVVARLLDHDAEALAAMQRSADEEIAAGGSVDADA